MIFGKNLIKKQTYIKRAVATTRGTLPNVSCNLKTRMKQLSNHTKEVVNKLKQGISTYTNMKDRVLFLQPVSGMWIDVTDDLGCSPLHRAVQEGCIRLVESLLLAGSCVNMPKGCVVTPIMIAINNNSPELVKILIKYGSRINGCFQGNIPSRVQMAQNIGNDVIT